MGQFRLGRVADAVDLRSLRIQFSFARQLDDELAPATADSYRWIVYEEDGRVLAFHRTLLVGGWAFFAGIHNVAASAHRFLVYELSRHVLRDLRAMGNLRGIVAWARPGDGKTVLCEKLGFRAFRRVIHRFIFRGARLQELRAKGRGEAQGWRPAMRSDEREVTRVVNAMQSFIVDPGFEPRQTGGWYVHVEGGSVDAVALAGMQGEALEVFGIYSEQIAGDLSQHLASFTDYIGADAKILRVNVDSAQVLTLIRLLSIKPETYAEGHRTICLRLEMGVGHESN